MPSWWTKTRKELPSTFNARAETITARPMFRDAFRERRCIIPASGYYEGKPTPTGKQPYYISARDGSILPFAGLWDEWHDPESGEQIRSCTIIVTDANALTRPIHKRMPVILVGAQQTAWLASAAAATELLRPRQTTCCNCGRCHGGSIGLATRMIRSWPRQFTKCPKKRSS